jgi:hypothetical protein
MEGNIRKTTVSNIQNHTIESHNKQVMTEGLILNSSTRLLLIKNKKLLIFKSVL